MSPTKPLIIGLLGGYFLIAGASAKAPVVPVYAMPKIMVPGLSQQVAKPRLPEIKSKAMAPALPAPKVEAKAAVVLEGKSGDVWYSQNADEVLPLASLTKLMSAIVFLQTKPDLSAYVPVVKDDLDSIVDYGTATEPVARVDLRSGEQVMLRDLLYAALIPSANNAVMTLVRATNLPMDQFIRLMNQETARLNIKAQFVDPTGLEKSNQASALEMAKLARYAFNHPILKKPLGLASYSFISKDKISHTVQSTNQLLGQGLGVMAGKTGYLTEAGYNLAIKAKKGDREVIIVVMGAPTIEARFAEAEKLLHWALP